MASADYQKGLTAAQSGDYATALRNWKPLAEEDDANSQNNLGVMFFKGQGVPQNYLKAMVFLDFCQTGKFCCSNISEWDVRNGTRDKVYAYMWRNLAASNANADGTVLDLFTGAYKDNVIVSD